MVVMCWTAAGKLHFEGNPRGSCSMHFDLSSYQVHRPVPRNPQQKLTPITSLWPFYKWGTDIAGPFPKGPVKVKFLIVAIDYFTKWIEAKPVATITRAHVKKFVWDNIVCRFKRANRSLGKGIKVRLDERSKNSVEEISHVLWAHCTMIKSSNGETPFSLMYGAEMVIPVEIGMPTLRTAQVDMIKNDEALGVNLDLLEEKREQAAIQEARSKAKMDKYYNVRVRSTCFCSEDFVYQNNKASRAKDGGKLEPKWEGPYEVIALGKGAYLDTTTKIPFQEHGTSATLRNFIRMKCKHLSHIRQAAKRALLKFSLL
nr:reverse transcriptase domain-containing protein [Tanacetum cinerariifolium]GEX76727.1 reverse transcriptase domain-containing protein [Tanacetum cinerariifolium]